MSCHCLLGYEFQRVGQLRYKCMLNPECWQRAFFILQKGHLFICPAEEGGAEDSINLRRLQELSESQPCHPFGRLHVVALPASDPSASPHNAGLVPPMDTLEKKELLVLVEMGR